MNSVFLCPHCSQSIEAGPEYFGAECACPRCGGAFVVPSAGSMVAEERGPGVVEALAEARQRAERAEAALQSAEGRQRELANQLEGQLLERGEELGRIKAAQVDLERKLEAAQRGLAESDSARKRMELERKAEQERLLALEGQIQELKAGAGRVLELENQNRELAEDLEARRQELRALEAKAAEQERENRELSSKSSRLEASMRPVEGMEEVKGKGPVPGGQAEAWTLSQELPDPEERSGSAAFWFALCLLLGSGLGIVCCLLVNRVSPEVWATVVNFGRKGREESAVAKAGGDRGRESQNSLRIDGLWAVVAPEGSGVRRSQDYPKLPTAFMGVAFGAPASALLKQSEKGAERGAEKGSEKHEWRESGGRLHREVEFAGRRGVHAVVVPDKEGRLVMGAYLKVASKQGNELKDFLEWAVSVNDDLVTRFGRPSELHQVSGVNDAEEVLEKISEGNDYYQAVWERDGQDTRLVLSIRELNPHNVIFRLDYVSVSLTKDFSGGE